MGSAVVALLLQEVETWHHPSWYLLRVQPRKTRGGVSALWLASFFLAPQTDRQRRISHARNQTNSNPTRENQNEIDRG